ncbi:unnamed protein product [Orchesella dallaii]|uniref:Peptidase metallopeptidase domain-containing protein n=1 Tax=Orchesella dallaii TaxID=48710 RepID=A0ABP1RZ14_9HEXA
MTLVILPFNNEGRPKSRQREKFNIKNQLTISLLILYLLVTIVNAAPTFENTDAMAYLAKYGWLNENSVEETLGAQSMRANSDMRKSIEEFQAFAGIPVTGELDGRTKETMMSPRCGVIDKLPDNDEASSYVLHGGKWEKEKLSYIIHSYPQNLDAIGGRYRVNFQIQKAITIWEKVANIKMKKAFSSEPDIQIRFASGKHGDAYAFNGQGGTLAHAFFPSYGGDVHFDSDEPWSISSYNGINLFQVAAHEFGHALGLKHSTVSDAIMAPIYRGYSPNFKLHPDDIAAIQKIYGERKSSKTPSIPIPTRPSTTRPPTTSPSTTPRSFTTQETTTSSPSIQSTTPVLEKDQFNNWNDTKTRELLEALIREISRRDDAVRRTRWNGTHFVPSNSSCLKEGTKIFMADMSEKPVELLQIGDIVLDKDLRPTRVLGVSYEFLLEQKFYGFDNKSFFFTDSHLFAGPSVENEGDLKLYAKSTKTLLHNNPLMKYLNVSDMDDHEKLRLFHHDGNNSVSVRNVTVSEDPQEYPPETPIYFIQVDSPTGTYIANGYVCRHEIPPIELWPNTMSILFRLMETEAFQKISQLPYTLETISFLQNVISQVVTEVKLFLERSELRKGDYGKPQEIMRLEDVGVEESIGKIFGNPTLSTAGVNLYARVGSIISPYLDDIEESKWKVKGRQVAALQSDLYALIHKELEKYF